MTIEQMKAEAAKILSIAPSQGEEIVKFSLNSGGIPRNQVGVKVTNSGQSVNWQGCQGTSRKGFLEVSCRKTGCKDPKGRDIYAQKQGDVEQWFVFWYSHGSPSYFDEGELVSPCFRVG